MYYLVYLFDKLLIVLITTKQLVVSGLQSFIWHTICTIWSAIVVKWHTTSKKLNQSKQINENSTCQKGREKRKPSKWRWKRQCSWNHL